MTERRQFAHSRRKDRQLKTSLWRLRGLRFFDAIRGLRRRDRWQITFDRHAVDF